jgi:hypothetical protein
VQLIQPGRDKIHHHALHDPTRDQLSAVAVLSVNDKTAAGNDSNRIARRCPRSPNINTLTCRSDLY